MFTVISGLSKHFTDHIIKPHRSTTYVDAAYCYRPASEQDSVMKYGLNRSATRFELSWHVEISRTCLRHVGNQVCDLNSVMEFSQSRSQTSSRTSWRAG